MKAATSENRKLKTSSFVTFSKFYYLNPEEYLLRWVQQPQFTLEENFKHFLKYLIREIWLDVTTMLKDLVKKILTLHYQWQKRMSWEI